MATADTTTEADQAQADKILQEKLAQAGDVAAPKDESSVPAPETAEDDIEKPINHKEWTFEAEYEIMSRGEMVPQVFKRTYIQKPLSYHAMAEFTGLLGRKLAEAMRGPDGLSLDRITPTEGGALPLEFQDGNISIASYEGVDSIVQGIAKIASYVPDVISESQCIWLRVPRNERELLIDIWSRPVDEGGMSMDQGEEMLEIFIEQNYDELDNFLQRYGRVKDKVQKMRERRKLKES